MVGKQEASKLARLEDKEATENRKYLLNILSFHVLSF
jgi:hypothetical protein